MKINEKNLISIATSNFITDMEGWLLKRNDSNKNFQRKWFVLKANLLFYFDKKQDKEPTGVVILEGCRIELNEDDEPYSFKIIFPNGTSNYIHVLCAASQKEMEKWMKALLRANYDYVNSLAFQLKHELALLEANSSELENIIAKQESPLNVLPSREKLLLTEQKAKSTILKNLSNGPSLFTVHDNSKEQFIGGKKNFRFLHKTYQEQIEKCKLKAHFDTPLIQL